MKYAGVLLGFIIVAGFFVIFLLPRLRSNEPSNPPSAETDEKILAVTLAKDRYEEEKATGKDLTFGPCLGTIMEGWIVDIAHNPRTPEDNKTENQCADYIEGKATHFVELDLDGNLIRVQ
jgi:hypothetical protein